MPGSFTIIRAFPLRVIAGPLDPMENPIVVDGNATKEIAKSERKKFILIVLFVIWK
jgi:hypothetical protein